VTRPDLVVRAATESDYPAIASLLDTIFEPRPYAQRLKLWRWRYDANPAKSGSIQPFIVGEQGGKIVGVHGLVPLRVKVGDQTLVASCSCDLAVDPAARSAGMKLKLRTLSKELSPLHISTSANEPANKITLALGGKEVASGRKKLIKPLLTGSLVKRMISEKGGKFWRTAGAITSVLVGKPVDWALAIGRKFTTYPQVEGATFEEIKRFDLRFDQFWESVSRETEIMHVRDSAYLNWRYVEYPFPGIQSVALVQDNRILGLCVIHVATDTDGLRFAAILELLVPRAETDAFDQLLGEAIRRAIESGAHTVTARTSVQEWEERLTRNGFRIRKMPFSPITYKNNSDIPNSVFDNNANWYVSLGDGDGCYYFD
jgi:hypothetical protein